MFSENVAVLLDRYRIKLVALLNNLLNKAMIEVMESLYRKLRAKEWMNLSRYLLINIRNDNTVV